MKWDPGYKPKLRPVEAFRMDETEAGMVNLRDMTGLSPVVLTVSQGALHVMSLMDGGHTCDAIRSEFQAVFNQSLSIDTLTSLLGSLDQSLLLEGATVEQHYESLQREYRNKPTRDMLTADALGIAGDSGDAFREMLAHAAPRVLPGPVKGLIAPHLDYPRGGHCYGSAYATLVGRTVPDRVIILGTNHAGRSTSVVATGKDFETPLGVTACDVEFLEMIESRCGSLRSCEVDHKREHSVELQLAWLQHLFGAGEFKMVPFLCPDPCGPTGIAPFDGCGVDLREFALSLSALMVEDGGDTLLVAGADLSHVGVQFGDERPVDDGFLEEVRKRDRRALDAIEANMPDAFLECVSEDDNPTRVCSAGNVFTLATMLPEAAVTVLDYRQAVTPATGVCVTCAAVAYV